MDKSEEKNSAETVEETVVAVPEVVKQSKQPKQAPIRQEHAKGVRIWVGGKKQG